MTVPGELDPLPDDASILQLTGVSKRFGGLKALDDVSFSIKRGEIAALIGPNGAGKTTMFNVITGFTRPEAGTIVFDGDDVTRLAPHTLAARGLARSFQTAKMFPSMTVHEILMTAAMLREGRKEASARADDVLDELAITTKAHRRPDELSLPDRQMVELGKCLALQPKLILLDEIMGGLNRMESDVPVAAIRKLADRGITFLMVEHVMPIVMSLAQHIVVLDFGRQIAAGTPAEVAANPAVQRSYLGGAA
ncbi:ABC transporter-like protein [Nocardioides sp. CF8]|uniref:ABC transporter ATP-binding protein n=1 Tax=Nocardioides sp. CF8 TaxID=110319 RepID=UPI00032D8BFE|nr:ABC transporter ATP-binding protein [Nocardioides sp. CF8]EON22155.1 ABC transporter-like protein [Nocardioides sp. CF8]